MCAVIFKSKHSPEGSLFLQAKKLCGLSLVKIRQASSSSFLSHPHEDFYMPLGFPVSSNLT